MFLIFFVRASGEAISGTLNYVSELFLTVIICSRLRRGDVRYATILILNHVYNKLVPKTLVFGSPFLQPLTHSTAK